jgi:hypothetical protein
LIHGHRRLAAHTKHDAALHDRDACRVSGLDPHRERRPDVFQLAVREHHSEAAGGRRMIDVDGKGSALEDDALAVGLDVL